MSSFLPAPSAFPLEIFHEIILYSHASSDHQTLASLSGVSRSFLEFTGPLLYEHVVLAKSEHVMPFLERLRLPRTPSDLPLLLPFNKTIKVTVLALPPAEELEVLAERTDLVRDPTLWRGGVDEVVVEWGRLELGYLEDEWVPRLLLVLDPKRRYLGKASFVREDRSIEKRIDCWEGCLLRIFIRSIPIAEPISSTLPPSSSSSRDLSHFDFSTVSVIGSLLYSRTAMVHISVRSSLDRAHFKAVPELLDVVARLPPLEREPLADWARELKEVYEGIKRTSLFGCNSDLLEPARTMEDVFNRRLDQDPFIAYTYASADLFKKIYESLGEEITKQMTYTPKEPYYEDEPL